ncbi:hypothetical protein JRQ81_004638 [Phrynocephalus forsythii]|uniref:Retrovirus-related Pol polyprotein from transposon TNT 1-94-like beta-barrel domain-containing protein n=1 Tax=Phrynocephalus forsythii TaxID=171643 RepID=A0A9Q1AVE7_9SAUR|nr:hypothetical protein JRQ81_004638 [Phrynocephalus forsythii]
MDSGASHHITNQLNFFKTFQPNADGEIKVATGKSSKDPRHQDLALYHVQMT